jgi:hypothetical protein
MTLIVYDSLANTICDAAVDSFDAGAGNATIEIRAGARPAVNVAPTGTVLAVFGLSATAFGNASANGAASTAAGTSLPKATTGLADGAATQGVMKDGDGNVKYTGSVGVGTGDFQLSNLSIATDQPVNLTALNFRVPQVSA